jgi:hypothetical protein
MALIWAFVVGLVVGYLCRGRLANLANLKLRGGWLVLVALLIQILIFPLGDHPPLVQVGTEWLHIISYLFLLGFVGLNFREYPLLLMGIGIFSNFLVIALNGGRMPASEWALRQAGLGEVADLLVQGIPHGNLILMSEATRLNFLGDLIPIPSFIPFANALSAGDLLLAIGIVLLLARGMAKKP